MRKRVKSLLSTSVVLLALGAAQPAYGSLLASDILGNLWDVNTTTGALSNSRFTGVTGLQGIAFSPQGILYGLTDNGSNHPNSLVKLIPETGAATVIGPTGMNIDTGDLGFDPVTGVLYGVQGASGSPAGPTIFTLNVNTGAATLLGNSGLQGSDLSAMAFDKTGNFFVLDTALGDVLLVNKTNAAIVKTVHLSHALGETAGMSFDPATGVPFVADNLGDSLGHTHLYTLNTTTGLLTDIGVTGTSADALTGLAFSAIPEPESIYLFSAGFAGLLFYSCLRRA